jgi:hypothetical protein
MIKLRKWERGENVIILNIQDLVTKINRKKEESVTNCKIISFCSAIKGKSADQRHPVEKHCSSPVAITTPVLFHN